ncbi:hypothetical protein LWI28_008113 [Acer negundo]|uniref:Uncharacterized protein n=1 Tax=Acer negundo TaxID=4023 RepID=A0AAD5IY36_ACENE|nr:hypothetical protein LWI28_008113 [Acer negundo]
MVKLPYFSKTKSEVVTKRFLLDAKTISKVKAEVTSGCGGGDHMHKTSTAEIVIALIWRAQINAARASYGFLRTSILSVAVNLRGKTFKKAPENCCGNIFTVGTARFEADDETTMGLNGFVDQVRGAIKNTIVEFGKQNEDDDGFFSKLIMKPCIEIAEQLRKGDVHRDTPVVKLPPLSKTTSEVVAKRFVLDTNTISKLKAEVTSCCGGGHAHKISTTEIVIALIWRAQINAAQARSGFLRTSLLSVAVNLRGKTFKKVPENCCGNIYTVCTARFQADETKMGSLNVFVDQVRDAIRNTVAEFGKQKEDEDGFFSKLIMKPCIEIDEQVRKGEGDIHRILTRKLMLNLNESCYANGILVSVESLDGILVSVESLDAVA